MVMRRSRGTVVSAEVSLGYDVDRADAQQALLAASSAADLRNSFVLITPESELSRIRPEIDRPEAEQEERAREKDDA